MRPLTMLALATLISACTVDVAPEPDLPPVQLDLSREAPDTLSEWGFFTGPLVDQNPAEGVLAYEVAAALWADHAGKGRFMALPQGEAATMGPDEGWTFPLNTIFIKSFFFDLDRRDTQSGAARTIETRLLRLEEGGWKSYIYMWNDEQTEATRTKVGGRVDVEHVDSDGQQATQLYLVPNEEECKNCHEIDDEILPLGPTVAQLNKTIERDGLETNQLQWLFELGAIDDLSTPPDQLVALPDPFDESNGDLDKRARSYLHGNCGHCHREGGGGGRSGLRLVWYEDRERRFGVCKGPVAAGSGTGDHVADIVPGFPEQSIFIFRMGSTDPEVKMPELPNLLPDDAGIDLITEWIEAMEPTGCF